MGGYWTGLFEAMIIKDANKSEDYNTTLSRPRRTPLPLNKIKTCRRLNWWALERAMDELEEKLKKTK